MIFKHIVGESYFRVSVGDAVDCVKNSTYNEHFSNFMMVQADIPNVLCLKCIYIYLKAMVWQNERTT